MPRTGRPEIRIDQKAFENLCGIQCTEKEICFFFGCCEDTLNAWCKRTYKDENGRGMTFSEVFQQKRGIGKISLRRNQFRLSENNATMAIWLGKQYLGQADNMAMEVAISEQEDDPLTKSLKEEAERMDNGKL